MMGLSRLARLKSFRFNVLVAIAVVGLLSWPAGVGACESAEGSNNSLQVGSFVSSPIVLNDGAIEFPEVLFIETTGSSNRELPFVSVDVELAGESENPIIQLGNFAVLPGQQGDFSYAFELPGNEQERELLSERIRSGELSLRLEARVGEQLLPSTEILIVNSVTLGRPQQ